MRHALAKESLEITNLRAWWWTVGIVFMVGAVTGAETSSLPVLCASRQRRPAPVRSVHIHLQSCVAEPTIAVGYCAKGGKRVAYVVRKFRQRLGRTATGR